VDHHARRPTDQRGHATGRPRSQIDRFSTAERASTARLLVLVAAAIAAGTVILSGSRFREVVLIDYRPPSEFPIRSSFLDVLQRDRLWAAATAALVGSGICWAIRRRTRSNEVRWCGILTALVGGAGVIAWRATLPSDVASHGGWFVLVASVLALAHFVAPPVESALQADEGQRAAGASTGTRTIFATALILAGLGGSCATAGSDRFVVSTGAPWAPIGFCATLLEVGEVDRGWTVAAAAMALLPLGFLIWRLSKASTGRWLGTTASLGAAAGVALLLLPHHHVLEVGNPSSDGASRAWAWACAAVAYAVAFLIAPTRRATAATARLSDRSDAIATEAPTS